MHFYDQTVLNRASILLHEHSANSSLICLSCDQLVASVANKVEEMANSGNLLDTQVVYVMATYSSVTTVMTEDSTADSKVRDLHILAYACTGAFV